MTDAIPCPRCQAFMLPGFVADATYGGNVQEKWVPGAPRTNFWRGLQVDDKQALPVTTLRCPKCGYLESYAN